jgi:ATP-dependent Lon protease
MGQEDKDDLIRLIDEDEDDGDIPDTMPLMPVRDVVIFSDMLLPLYVGRERSIRAVEEAVTHDGYLLLATQKDSTIEDPSMDEIFTTGTVSRVLRILKLPDGRVKALVQGLVKARISDYLRKRSMYRVKIEMVPDTPLGDISLEIEALMRNVKESAEKIMVLRGEMSGDVGAILHAIDDPGKLADLVASNLKLKIEESQELLEIDAPPPGTPQKNQ